MLDDTYNVWSVAATSAFGVVGMDCAVFDSGDGGFDEAGFIECVCMDETLNVEFVADCEAGIDG